MLASMCSRKAAFGAMVGPKFCDVSERREEFLRLGEAKPWRPGGVQISRARVGPSFAREDRMGRG
ncbi:hypothetical protein BN2476_960106 [Paraburkholderia piptadeniae]|uniref:Uncharacterized protein n=1 Tax=Paraburkholderia piptadeniae TaxID=1701573 RepID=A0A1N7SU76_9BURK|nr:hypothetical protein BN2476_960106 [Paraburkholderia piptadeniae]